MTSISLSFSGFSTLLHTGSSVVAVDPVLLDGVFRPEAGPAQAAPESVGPVAAWSAILGAGGHKRKRVYGKPLQPSRKNPFPTTKIFITTFAKLFTDT